MRKQGHHLVEIRPALAGDLVDALRERYSISTAEEFVSAAARVGDLMQRALGLEPPEWNRVLEQVKDVIPKDNLAELEQPSKIRFPKGAKLGSDAVRRTGLDKYITEEG